MDIGKPIATIMMRIMNMKKMLHGMMFIGHFQMLIIQKNFDNMQDKEKFNIIYKHFAKPIADMKMTYNNSAMTIEAKVVNPEVSKCFQALIDALNKQLNSYRK